MSGMFQFVSGHNSGQSIPHHSSRSNASELKCVSDTISNRFENHQPQKTIISTVIYAPFIQNSNQMASRLTATTSFPRVFLQLLQFSGQLNSKLFGSQGCSDDKKLTWVFQHFFLRFVYVAVQFCFRCKFSIHEERCSSQVWQWRDFPRLITILCCA